MRNAKLRTLLGTTLTIATGAAINFTPGDASWWLIAGPTCLVYLSFELRALSYRQHPVADDPVRAPERIGGAHRAPSRVLSNTALLASVVVLLAGTVVRFAVLAPAITTLRISPGSYDTGSSVFSDSGPYYVAGRDLAGQGVSYAHAYGNKVGSLVYRVTMAPFSGQSAELTARLSADEPGFHGTPQGYSDVTLVINGAEQDTRRVTPDDAKGTHYQWRFSSTLLHEGTNTVEFRVSATSQFHNGICVYGESLLDGLDDEWITIRSH